MRILVWNLNHRARARRIPGWVAEEIALVGADLVCLTEYVEAQDHERFAGELALSGLAHCVCSAAVKGQNQVLLAARTPLGIEPLADPGIHESVPSNIAQARLTGFGLTAIGFRMPCYNHRGSAATKVLTRDWLCGTIVPMVAAGFLMGDFNIDPADSAARCGDTFRLLESAGWTHALPAEGASFGKTRRIDHLLFKGPGRLTKAWYSWDFLRHIPSSDLVPVGQPDHAMLIVELGITHTPTTVSSRPR